MTLEADRIDRPKEDPVSNVLKWVLLVVAVASFAILGWTTKLTYEAAPPFPDRFVASDGTVLMTAADIVSGKAGFQRADLMDYGSLYGMGSYFGEDYTAANLVRLATLTQDNLAKANGGKALSELTMEQRASVKAAMQAELQGVDLTKQVAVTPAPLAAAITALRSEIVQSLLHHDFAKGWTQAYSLDQQGAEQTADFLIYSSLTTVARRPGTDASWTQNWPFEPVVGNTPTTSTFRWTWIIFCFTFFAFGAVLFIYQRFLNDPDQAPMDPVLARFRPLTTSQRGSANIFSSWLACCCCRFSSARSWPTTISTGRASTASKSIASYPLTSSGMSTFSRRLSGSACLGSARRCFSPRRSAVVSPKVRASSWMCSFGSRYSSSSARSSATISASWGISVKAGSGSAIRGSPTSSSAERGRSGSSPVW